MLAMIFVGIILGELGLLSGWILFLYIIALIIQSIISLLTLGAIGEMLS